MTNLHKIRARIRSVNSTQQITRTMKMIAVSKLRKTQTSLAGVRLFADKSQAVLNALLAGDASFEHPYLTPRRHVGRVCYVVFWGNRGLCGAYNQLLLRHLEGLVRAEARPCSVIVCGRWGRDVLAGTDLPVRQIFSDLSDTPTMAEALEICYDAVAEPKVLVACGTEACSGGLFAASRAIDRSFFDRHRVDLWLPGAPTHPMVFIDGIRTLLGRKKRE